MVRHQHIVVFEKLEKWNGGFQGVDNVALRLRLGQNTRAHFLAGGAIRLNFDPGIPGFECAVELFVRLASERRVPGDLSLGLGPGVKHLLAVRLVVRGQLLYRHFALGPTGTC